MARSPVPVVDVPFAEGAPIDNLEVEQFGDDEVLIGDPDSDVVDEPDNEFDSNLAEVIDEKELNAIASQLIGNFNTDKSARSEWEERYKSGLKTLDPDGGMDEAEDARASRGLSVVVHPLIAEAATQFNARAIAELYPAGGPVKTTIIGESDEETEDQARHVRDFMNYQITQEMPEYFPDLDQMLFHLPLIGQTFKKVWWDANLDPKAKTSTPRHDTLKLYGYQRTIITDTCNLVGISLSIILVAAVTCQMMSQLRSKALMPMEMMLKMK